MHTCMPNKLSAERGKSGYLETTNVTAPINLNLNIQIALLSYLNVADDYFSPSPALAHAYHPVADLKRQTTPSPVSVSLQRTTSERHTGCVVRKGNTHHCDGHCI